MSPTLGVAAGFVLVRFVHAKSSLHASWTWNVTARAEENGSDIGSAVQLMFTPRKWDIRMRVSNGSHAYAAIRPMTSRDLIPPLPPDAPSNPLCPNKPVIAHLLPCPRPKFPEHHELVSPFC